MKALLVSMSLSFVGLVFSTMSWSADIRFKDISSGCTVILGDVLQGRKGSVKFIGSCIDGLADGKGKLAFAREDGRTLIYEGDFKNGKKHGRGKQKWDGNVYEGEFREGLWHGKGVAVFENGDRYEGEFHNSALHGRGVFTKPNGSRLEGVFEKNLFKKGTAFYPNGDTFQGEVRILGNGHGTYTTSDGEQFIGGLRHWKRDGPGECKKPDENFFRCEFKDGALVTPENR